MATDVTDFIEEIRYDLRDQGKQKYDNTYVLTMMNRGIRVLERELVAVGSGLTTTQGTVSLTSGDNSVDLPSTMDSIRRVYISQNELYFMPMEQLYRRRVDVIGTSTGQPSRYSIWGISNTGREMLFDYEADATYTITYIGHQVTGDLALVGEMPYDDMFNDYIREGIVMVCRKTKKDEILQTDLIWRELFRQYMYQFNLAISSPPRYWVKDF